MKKVLAFAMSAIMALGMGMATPQKAFAQKDTLTIVWYPNESGADLESTRNHMGEKIAEATGKKVEHQLTTDYAIAIEAIANGKADLAFMGAEGYVQAHKKNEKVIPLVVSSDKKGTLDGAVYYSWFAVNKGDEEGYKSGDAFSIENMVGKKISFVSNSSTSGFVVPSSALIKFFSAKDAKWAKLTKEDLMEGGQDKLFPEVLFGGSHQGSAVNLLSGKAEVAAFCDVCVANYVSPVDEAKVNVPGAVYKVNKDAAEPFNTVPEKEFVLISSTPVLNAPFAVNSETVSAEDIEKITALMTSDEVSKDEKIFIHKDSKEKGLWKQEGNSRFLKVEDNWFDPIRKLSE